jgi:hypothetical protein
MRTPVSVLSILFCILIGVSAAAAQAPHAAPPSAIDQALEQHAAALDDDRAVVQRVLERPDVRALAAKVGVDVRRAQSAVATLQGEQLAQLAGQARQAEQALAGGQGGSITLSYTLIIIGLLVLILLVLIL